MKSLNLILLIQVHISIAVTPSARVVRQKNKCAVKDIKNALFFFPSFLNICLEHCISTTGDSLLPFLIVLMREGVQMHTFIVAITSMTFSYSKYI